MNTELKIGDNIWHFENDFNNFSGKIERNLEHLVQRSQFLTFCVLSRQKKL